MNKSQIKMGETLAVLVIFFFLLMFGYSFYAGIQQRNYQQEVVQIESLRAVQLAQRVYFLPEIQCSSGYALVRESCFDTLKMEKLKETIEGDGRVFYRTLFGSAMVNITEIYPGNQQIIIYDQNASKQNKRSTQMPVALYDPVQKTYGFGVLTIDYYFGAS